MPMNSPVQEIKDRLSIVDVISPYVKLEKSGLHMRGKCPFHNEKTPSFFVSPDRNTFHCFGCGKGGDIFTFMQDIEGLTFPETLKTLADRAGVTLEQTPQKVVEGKEDNDLIYRALELATKYYEAVLPKFPESLEYIHNRGISDASIKTFRIGYAPDGWRNLSTFLSSKGLSEDIQEKAGLVIKSAKGYYDRFRGRIMFPLANPQGKIVGFSGRIFPENKEDPLEAADAAKAPPAKYVNSPETVVYNKSRILFGYDKAKQAISRAKRAVLVEGQMDLVMAHQTGTEEAVAASGTALTSYHLSLLKRFTDKLVLAFDADSAGFKAAERAVNLAFDTDMDVSVIRMAKGMDPADLIKADEKSWHELLKQPKHFIETYVDVLRETYQDDRMFKKEVTTNVLPYVARIKSSIDKSHFISLIARRLNVREETVLEDVKRVPKEKTKDEFTATIVVPQMNKDRKQEIIKALFSIALWKQSTDAEMHERIMKELRDRLKEETDTQLPGEDEHNTLIFEAELAYKDRGIELETKDLLRNLDRELTKELLGRLMDELNHAELSGDKEKSNTLLYEIRKTKNQLEALSIES